MAATVVLDQQVRNGTFSSASLAVPLNADGTPQTNPANGQPYSFVDLESTMSQADAGDGTKTARGSIRVSYDGTTYVSFPAGDWEWNGGVINAHTGLYRTPGLGVSLPTTTDGSGNTVYPQRVMALLDTEGNSLNTGLTLELS